MKHEYSKDHYGKKARQEGNVSRAYYKLREIDNRFRVFRKSDFVLDIGCYPGGWLAYSKDKASFVAGVDIKNVSYKAENTVFIRGDIYDDNTIEQLKEAVKSKGKENYNVVMSDAMVHTTGSKELDSYRSSALIFRIISLLPQLLRQDGCLAFKIFQGEEFNEVLNEVKKLFEKVRCYKPKSSRQRSREMYVICKGYKLNEKN